VSRDDRYHRSGMAAMVNVGVHSRFATENKEMSYSLLSNADCEFAKLSNSTFDINQARESETAVEKRELLANPIIATLVATSGILTQLASTSRNESIQWGHILLSTGAIVFGRFFSVVARAVHYLPMSSKCENIYAFDASTFDIQTLVADDKEYIQSLENAVAFLRKARKEKGQNGSWTLGDEGYHFARGVEAYFSSIVTDVEDSKEVLHVAFPEEVASRCYFEEERLLFGNLKMEHCYTKDHSIRFQISRLGKAESRKEVLDNYVRYHLHFIQQTAQKKDKMKKTAEDELETLAVEKIDEAALKKREDNKRRKKSTPRTTNRQHLSDDGHNVYQSKEDDDALIQVQSEKKRLEDLLRQKDSSVFEATFAMGVKVYPSYKSINGDETTKAFFREVRQASTIAAINSIYKHNTPQFRSNVVGDWINSGRSNNVFSYQKKRNFLIRSSKVELEYTEEKFKMTGGMDANAAAEMVIQYILGGQKRFGPRVSEIIIVESTDFFDGDAWNEASKSFKRKFWPVDVNDNSFHVIMVVEKMKYSMNELLYSTANDFLGQTELNLSVSKALQSLWVLLENMSRAGVVLFDFHVGNVMFTSEDEARIVDFDPNTGALLSKDDLFGTSGGKTSTAKLSEGWKTLLVLNMLTFAFFFSGAKSYHRLFQKWLNTPMDDANVNPVIISNYNRFKKIVQEVGEAIDALDSVPATLLNLKWKGGCFGKGRLCGPDERQQFLYMLPTSFATVSGRMEWALRTNVDHHGFSQPIQWLKENFEKRHNALEKIETFQKVEDGKDKPLTNIELETAKLASKPFKESNRFITEEFDVVLGPLARHTGGIRSNHFRVFDLFKNFVFETPILRPKAFDDDGLKKLAARHNTATGPYPFPDDLITFQDEQGGVAPLSTGYEHSGSGIGASDPMDTTA